MDYIPLNIVFRNGETLELRVVSWRLEEKFLMLQQVGAEVRQYFNWDDIFSIAVPPPPLPPDQEEPSEEE